MKRTNISNNVIRRLPRYLRKLDDLKAKGEERISSGELGRQMGLTPSQIRQDFSCFGEFGQQGYGYNIESLGKEIGQILGTYRDYSAILVGPGHLGTALVENFRFIIDGYTFLGAFVYAMFAMRMNDIGAMEFASEVAGDYVAGDGEKE